MLVTAEAIWRVRTSGKGKGLNLLAFLAAVRRYRLTFGIVAGAVFVLWMMVILLLPSMYVSSTQLMVSIQGSTTAAAYQNEEVANRRIHSYIPLLTSGVVTQRVVDKLGLPMTASEFAAKIDATNVPPKTSLIDVEVTDDSPDRARLMADTLASEFITYAASIETPTGEDSHKIKTTVVTAATEGRKNHFEPALLGVLAGITALLLGSVAVWVRARADRRAADDGNAVAADGAPLRGDGQSAPSASEDDQDVLPPTDPVAPP